MYIYIYEVSNLGIPSFLLQGISFLFVIQSSPPLEWRQKALWVGYQCPGRSCKPALFKRQIDDSVVEVLEKPTEFLWMVFRYDMYIWYTNTLEDAVFCSVPAFQSSRLKAQLSTGLLLQCPAVVWVLWAIPYLQQATRPNQATLAVRPVWSCNCLSALSLMTWFLGKCASQIVSQAFSHVSSSYLKTTNSSSSSMSSKLLLSEDPWILDHLSNFHSGVISWTWILWNATASFFRGTQCWQAHSLWVYPQ